MKLFKHQSIIFTLATLCLFASSISLNQVFAVDDNTDFNISVDPTLEITIPDSVNLLINPSVDGTIADTSFDITVGTNNLTGYTLTMYNDSSNLTSTDSSAIIPTLSNEIAKSNFPVNHWGYSLDDNTYKPITTATSGTLLKTTETTSAADTTTINLATKVDLDKPAGIYTNTFVFNVVANELPSYTITWNANGGTVNPTTSSIQYGNPIGTLPTPTYDGYNFLGWFTTADGGTEISSATIVTGTATYYAHWEKSNPFDTAFAAANKTKQDGYYKMQDMTSNICNAVPTPTTATEDISTLLIDTRDSKVYWINKLKDGHCWMTQNLDYDINADGTDEIATIGSSTTSIWDSSSSYPPQATSTSIFSSTNALGTYSYDPGNKKVDLTTDIICNSSTTVNSDCHYHIGNYYQWNAATAGTGGKISYTDATGSVCPKGWRIPDINHFNTIQSNYQSFTNSPLWFVKSGAIMSGSLVNVASDGYIWTSYGLEYSTMPYPGGGAPKTSYAWWFSTDANSNYYDRYYGFSVRCVAE